MEEDMFRVETENYFSFGSIDELATTNVQISPGSD